MSDKEPEIRNEAEPTPEMAPRPGAPDLERESRSGLTEIFSILRHPRRRYLLYSVATDGDESLATIARKLASWEGLKSCADVTAEEQRAVHTSLYHTHLPALVASNVLTHDRDTGVVTASENFEEFRSVLDGAGGELDSRQEAHAQQTRCE
jgi:hypothetical protein